MIDPIHQIIFIWNAKCGCTFLKKLFFAYLGFENFTRKNVHKLNKTKWLNSPLPSDHEKYRIYLFCRNPYELLVSGFLNKLVVDSPNYITKQLNTLHNVNGLSFSEFVDCLNEDKNNKFIDEHHFGKQIRQDDINRIKIDKIFDINDIDYTVLDNHFGKNHTSFLCTKVNWNKTKKRSNSVEKIHDKKIEELKAMDGFPSYSNFFSKELKMKVYNIYQGDFEFFASKGLSYDVSVST
jgi:hypothetical protein